MKKKIMLSGKGNEKDQQGAFLAGLHQKKFQDALQNTFGVYLLELLTQSKKQGGRI